jgi:hypothetical protein
VVDRKQHACIEHDAVPKIIQSAFSLRLKHAPQLPAGFEALREFGKPWQSSDLGDPGDGHGMENSFQPFEENNHRDSPKWIGR